MNAIDIPFQVSFTHRLRHTTDISGRDFGVLEDLLRLSAVDKTKGRTKTLFWVDSNLTTGGDDSSTDESPDFAARLESRLRASDAVDVAGPTTVIPGGEACKHSEETLRQLIDQIHSCDLDRRSVIVVAGGGAVLDVAGFAAAIAHRGVRLIRVPSTTLAQADSGVGVKNAINYYGKKNWIGTFAVPWAVINDTSILQTLPDRDFRSGFTEAVKVSLIKDAAFFEFLRRNALSIHDRDTDVCDAAIRRSCEFHLNHITGGGDPFEALEARPLDFGHWSAHKLEPMTGYDLRHGEAVGIGVMIDVIYSSMKFGLPESDVDAVAKTLRQLGTPIWNDALSDPDAVLRGLEEFRQHLGGRLTVTMLRRVGKPVDVHEIDADAMKDAIAKLRSISRAAS